MSICKDCADNGGICPHSGKYCDPESATEVVRQRVKELEFELSKKQREAFHCGYASRNEELAALKKLSDQWHEYYRRKHHPNCALLESAGTDSLGNKCTCIECIKQDLAVLVANGKEPNPIIPEGWQLVPVEPTPEMIETYLDAINAYWVSTDELPRKLDKWRNGTPEAATREGYKAMLSAARQAIVRPAAEIGKEMEMELNYEPK